MPENEPILKNTVSLLEYLCQIAGDTQGAEVWRALFAEMLRTARGLRDGN